MERNSAFHSLDFHTGEVSASCYVNHSQICVQLFSRYQWNIHHAVFKQFFFVRLVKHTLIFFSSANCLRQSDCNLISNDTLCLSELPKVGTVYGKCFCHQLDLAHHSTGLCSDPTVDVAGALNEGRDKKGKRTRKFWFQSNCC